MGGLYFGVGLFLAVFSIGVVVAGRHVVPALIQDGDRVGGSVDFGQRKLYTFAASPLQSVYPRVEMTINILSLRGEADAFCTTRALFEENRGKRKGKKHGALLGPDFYRWRTEVGKGVNSITVPAKDVERLAETMDMLEPQFVCAVVGVAGPDVSTHFLLEFVLQHTTPVLVDDERSTMREIFLSCCMKEDSCDNWPREGSHFPTTEFRDDDDSSSGLQDMGAVSMGIEIVVLDFCHVRGCECNTEGRLKALDLSGYGLDCPFPGEQLQRLKGLEILLLTENAISGEVQGVFSSLFNLTDLKWLALDSNSLVGRLDGGEDENTDRNAFCEQASSQLEYLNLARNIIQGSLPSCVFSGSLTHFSADRNALTGRLPTLIDPASPMVLFSAIDNEFSGTIPESLGLLRGLQHLQLSRNKLTGTLPQSLAQLPQLLRLNLDGNRLTGNIPDQTADSQTLMVIRLNDNQFDRMPYHWDHSAGSPALSVLDLSNNLIAGTFPVGLGRAPNLTSVALGGNHLFGLLPTLNGLFPKANRIKLESNDFDGPIPEEFSTLGIFQGATVSGAVPLIPVLDLSSNDLTGVIPGFLDPESSDFPTRLLVYLQGNNLTCGDKVRTLGDKVFGVECVRSEESMHGDKTSAMASTVAAVALPVLAAFTIGLMFFVKRRHDEERQTVRDGRHDVVSHASTVHALPNDVWKHHNVWEQDPIWQSHATREPHGRRHPQYMRQQNMNIYSQPKRG